MHAEAWTFVAQLRATFGSLGHIVELGSRDFNGSVRPLFTGALSYVGVDLYPGYSVDIVGDAAQFAPSINPDLILCCETLEHAPQADAIVRNAAHILAPGGTLVVTCATDPRAPHSGYDGGHPRDDEYYGNVPPDDLVRWIEQAGLELTCQQVHTSRGDLYAVAHKPGRTS